MLHSDHFLHLRVLNSKKKMDAVHSFEDIPSATRLHGVTTQNTMTFTNCLPKRKKAVIGKRY